MVFTVSPVGSSDKVVLDTTYLTDPVTYSFSLPISNQSTQPLYFKIRTNDPNWTITSPSGGVLGEIGEAGNAEYAITIQRAKPTTDTTETVTFTVEAYTDSNYTNLVDSTTFSITITLADIRHWQNVTIYNFDDGTAQGWSLGSLNISNDLSVEAGGYSAKGYTSVSGSHITKLYNLTRSITLPNNANVALSLMFATKSYVSNSSTGNRVDINYLKVTVNGTDEYYANLGKVGYYFDYKSGTVVVPWKQAGVDLSKYAGQQVTIKIEFSVSIISNANFTIWIDDIIIAGNG